MSETKLFMLVNLRKSIQTAILENKRHNIDGTYLNHLRYADDIVLIRNDYQELKQMMVQFHVTSKMVDLKINLSETKIMS